MLCIKVKCFFDNKNCMVKTRRETFFDDWSGGVKQFASLVACAHP